MIYFYCTSWQFFQMIVKWRISPTTEQIMFTFSIPLFHFYSHIPCGMWLSYIWSIKITKIISTHTSRVGCDQETYLSRTYLCKISTHTSRVGCDTKSLSPMYCCSHFYSHIPCGMWRDVTCCHKDIGSRIYTHPVWDVTGCDVVGSCIDTVSCRTHPVWDVTGCDGDHIF